MSEPVTIVLFRRDLRVSDNRALAAAASTGKPLVALFILDEDSKNVRAEGAASRWWLHHSLRHLEGKLDELGVALQFRRGPTNAVVETEINKCGADTVLWNRRYDPAESAVDAALKASLRQRGVECQSFAGALLHEPSRLKTGSGGYYKVFSAFWRALDGSLETLDPVDAPAGINGWRGPTTSLSLDALELLPKQPDWSGGLVKTWTPGEDSAGRRLGEFIEHDLADYEMARDMPARSGTSRLSPHLAFGEVTPVQIMAALRPSQTAGTAKFRKEIGWREFSYHLLAHNPDLCRAAFRPEFDRIEWQADTGSIRAWQRGLTGYPIVDAGMRQLWETGWMHNRVRMIVASFLSKHLLIDWREGERWFWDTLVDADVANNAAGWQWVAGSGADAAPYFRVFNPVLQGEKFDPDGEYVRRYIPELAAVPARYVHRPWTAPADVLARSQVRLGKTYPQPIVDHMLARNRVLEAYRAIAPGG
jgi:deoxyribodipyrimidine photo-lyase